METIAGEVILVILGNPDVLKVLAVFAGTVAVLMLIIYMWKQVEDWRQYR